MGLFDDLSKAVKPHADTLNATIALHGAALHNQLTLIRKAQDDLARGDIGDRWHRITFKKEVQEGEPVALAQAPVNTMYAIQSLVADGIFNKSPAFIIEASGQMIASVIKEGVGSENFGGDAVLLPGEKAFIVARGTGIISVTLVVIRRLYPSIPHLTDMGRANNQITPINTHDPARDVIASRTDQYIETKPESIDAFTSTPDPSAA